MKGLTLDYKNINYKTEILAGLTVAIILVPEAIAFSFIAGVSPLVGLYAAFIMGLVTAIIGGRPGMISGATGAIALVLVPLISTYGVEYLFPAVIIGGCIQSLIGVLKLGKFIRIIPHPVMIGFVNGLGFMIFSSQFTQFKIADANGVLGWMQGSELMIMLGLVALTMVVMFFMPKITKAVPGALIAIIVVSAIVIGFDLDVSTIGGKASIAGGFPSLQLPTLFGSWESAVATIAIVFPFSLKMAAVGLIESLLTLSVIDDVTSTRGNSNKESRAQGIANIICGFFGAMGGCVTFGQSMLNISSGARTRVSSFVAAITLLAFVLYISGFIEMIPMAALVGVMFMIAFETVEWSSLRIFRKMPFFDVLIVVVVTLITVFYHDLALAVLVGVVLSALNFAWGNAIRIRARKSVDEKGQKHYAIYGPLFFASTKNFIEKFDPENDPQICVVDFSESRVVDMSAIDAITTIIKKYEDLNKTLVFKALSGDCLDILAKANIKVTVDQSTDDPRYRVVYDL